MEIQKNSGIKNFCLSFVLFSLPFGLVCMFLFQNLQKGMILGGLAGLLYAVGISVFCAVIGKRMKGLRSKLEEESRILYDGGANHWMGKEAVGGWLFLLEDDVYFVSHNMNLQVNECRIPYQEIQSIRKGRNPRSICLELKSGRQEEFVVNHGRIWREIISKQLWLSKMPGECRIHNKKFGVTANGGASLSREKRSRGRS